MLTHNMDVKSMSSFKLPQDEAVKDLHHPAPDCNCKLRTISNIPGVSTIYFCPRCNAYWEFNADRGWDLLSREESAPVLLSS